MRRAGTIFAQVGPEDGIEDALTEQVINAISKQPIDPESLKITSDFIDRETRKDGFSINSIIRSIRGGFETTLLYCAARNNNLLVADYLLECGASPYETKPKRYGDRRGTAAENLVSLRGNSALHAACFRGHLDMVQLMLVKSKCEQSANFPFDLVNDDGDLCTDFFAHGQDQTTIDGIRELIIGAYYRDVPISNTAMLSAAENPEKKDILERAINLNNFPVDERISIDISNKSSFSTTLLFTAARANNDVGVKYLVEQCRADPNVRVSGDNTALHVASYRGFVDVVRILILHHADPTLINANGETCTSVFHPGVNQSVKNEIIALCNNLLHRSLEDKFVQVCESLDQGTQESFSSSALLDFITQEPSSINAVLPIRAGIMTTLLYTASRAGKADAVNLLLGKGADPDIQVSGGNTCLMVSGSRQHRAVVTSLLKHGANPLLQNHTGETFVPVDEDAVLAAQGVAPLSVLEMWTKINSSRISKALVVRISASTHRRAPLLFEAARANQTEAAKYLLNLGADPNIGDEMGNSPLHISCSLGFKGMVTMLLTFNANPDLLNKDGEAVDSKKASSVPQETFAGIKRQIKQARDQRLQRLEEEELVIYVKSLEMRRIHEYPSAAQELKKQVRHIMAPNIQLKHAAQDLQRRVFSVFVSETAQHQNRSAKNPILAGLIIDSIDAVHDTLWRSLEWADWVSVNQPAMLPSKCSGINDLFRDVCQSALRQFVEKVTAGIQHNIRSEILSLIHASTSVSNLEQISMQITDILVRQAQIQVLSCPTLGRIARHCIVQNDFELLRQDMPTEKKDLVDCHCICLLGSSKPFLHVLGNLMKGIQPDLIKRVARKILAAHTPPPNLRVTAYEKFRHKVDSVLASSKSAVNTLHALDDLAITYLKEAVEESVQIIQGGESSTVQRYIQNVVHKMLQKLELEYKSPGEQLALNSLLVCDPPYHLGCIKRHLNQPDEISAFVRSVQAPPSITPACKSRFEDFRTAHIATIRQQTSFNHSIKQYLRPLHLNVLWCRMPCYAQLSDVMSNLQSSNILLIQADTGSGKSVLLPQYLAFHEKDLRIFVTQPRREPTTSIGSHVQSQYGEKDVGYQVAGVDNCAPSARLQYCTDGLLLQRVWSGADMSDWCIVIDEIHERNVNMDMLFLLSMHRMKHGRGPRKLILASAKVDPTWFKDSVAAVNRCFPTAKPLVFKSLTLDVKSPFKVAESAPPNGYLIWDPKKSLAAQPKLAAQHAMRLVVKDPSVKVLVFLTSPEEVRESVAEFEKLSNKTISCAGIHAKATGIHYSLQKSRVIFSNNIAETSLTIPALTHVVDFTTSTKVKIDRQQNELDIAGDRCSSFACLQRRGRLGRTAPGEYCAMYDPAQLQATSETSFDVLSNEHLLQCEIRTRHYLQSTLFQPPAPGLKTLGIGLADTQNICAMLPRDPIQLEIGAMLNLTPAMTKAFVHAATKPGSGECALAILWLCAMLETREPPVPPRTPLPVQFRSGLGLGGDHGILLQIFSTYEAERINPGFDLKQWCQANGDVQPSFILSAEAQIKSLLQRCQELHAKGVQPLTKDPATYQGPAAWTWNAIAEALLQGFWRNTAKRVDYNLKTHDLIAPYRQLDSTQKGPLFIFPSSIWFQSGGGMPQYVLYNDQLVRIKGRSFMSFVCEVSEALLEAVCVQHGDQVVQSIGLQKRQHEIVAANHALAPYAGAAINMAPNFSPALLARTDPSKSHLHSEIVVTGQRVAVSKVMDAVAKDILQGLQQKAAAALAAAPAPGVVPFMVAFGTPSATPADLGALDPAMERRLRAAASPRTIQDLQAALSGDERTAALALCNIFVNRFGCKVKGGAVRDAVIRNLKPSDIDLELPRTINQASWQAELQGWTQTMQTDYNLRISVGGSRKVNNAGTVIQALPARKRYVVALGALGKGE